MKNEHELIKDYYGKTLRTGQDLQTSACCGLEMPDYTLAVLRQIHPGICEKFYGCGSPLPPALKGCTVLDLGCGSGRDSYIAAYLVGQEGRVVGVDMTEEQLAVARRYEAEQIATFGYTSSNIDFRQGYIEDLGALGIADDSVDVVISNCVINLSPAKENVFREIYRVLRPGGELFFADVFADRRLPESLRDDPVARGECLGGALYTEDFRRLLRRCGWEFFYYTSVSPLAVVTPALAAKVADVNFTTRTVRAFKAAGLEDQEEDYGQTVEYLGNMEEDRQSFKLAAEVEFPVGREVPAGANTCAALRQSRYAPYFRISERGAHGGVFLVDSGSSGCCC
jgi:SAM-dependent methyltransferase